MTTTVLGLSTVAVVLVAVVLAAAGGVLVAEVRAQDAADAAALAAAHAARRAGSPRVAAREAARGSGAALVHCDCGGPTVTVTVRVDLPAATARLTRVGHRSATAAARLVPASR